jgi:hypothetical protein
MRKVPQPLRGGSAKSELSRGQLKAAGARKELGQIVQWSIGLFCVEATIHSYWLTGLNL